MRAPLLHNEPVSSSSSYAAPANADANGDQPSYISEYHQTFTFKPIPQFQSPELDGKLGKLKALTRKVFDCYDLNKDGVLTFAEYCKVGHKLSGVWKRPKTDEQLRAKFEQLGEFAETIEYARFEVVRLKSVYAAHEKDVKRQLEQSDHDTWEESVVTVDALLTCTMLHYHTLTGVVLSLSQAEGVEQRHLSKVSSHSAMRTAIVALGRTSSLS